MNKKSKVGEAARESILQFIRWYRAQHGYSPSLRDMATALDIPSTSTVNYHLEVLENEGRIERDPAIARSTRIIDA